MADYILWGTLKLVHAKVHQPASGVHSCWVDQLVSGAIGLRVGGRYQEDKEKGEKYPLPVGLHIFSTPAFSKPRAKAHQPSWSRRADNTATIATRGSAIVAKDRQPWRTTSLACLMPRPWEGDSRVGACPVFFLPSPRISLHSAPGRDGLALLNPTPGGYAMPRRSTSPIRWR